jgi:hypothetical protein
MKNKSLVWQILSLAMVLAGIYGNMFGATGQLVIGVFSCGITALLQSPILSSGTWPKGWSTAMWIMQAAAIIIQVANYMGDQQIVPASAINIFVMTVNAFLATFIKDYSVTKSK